MIYKEKRNEDQPLSPHIHENTNNLLQHPEENVYEEKEKGINLLNDVSQNFHLTKDDYENSLICYEVEYYQERCVN